MIIIRRHPRGGENSHESLKKRKEEPATVKAQEREGEGKGENANSSWDLVPTVALTVHIPRNLPKDPSRSAGLSQRSLPDVAELML